jgi:hypothetical protein
MAAFGKSPGDNRNKGVSLSKKAEVHVKKEIQGEKGA